MRGGHGLSRAGLTTGTTRGRTRTRGLEGVGGTGLGRGRGQPWMRGEPGLSRACIAINAQYGLTRAGATA
eukprot:3658909-Alexandrium_andersonii.AAC.1